MTNPRFPVARAALVMMCVLLAAGCNFMGGHKVHMPKKPPANTLVIFYPAPSGDANARYYSAGFTAALAQTLDGVRPPIVYQAGPYGDEGPLRNAGPRYLSGREAEKIVKAMGARYGLTGDLQVAGGRVTISLQLLDAVRPSRDKKISGSSALADLTLLEPTLARQVIAGMGLRVSDEQSKALGKSGFTKPKTLMLLGKALLIKDPKQSLAAMSQAWRGEPTSLLATYHLLMQYTDSGFSYKDIAKSTLLPQVVGSASKSFGDDPAIKEALAWLSVRKYEFSTAEIILTQVAQASPKTIMPHSTLAYVSMYRHDWDAAIEEAEKAVKLWPTRPGLHANLAQAYARKAASERNRHPVKQLSDEIRKRWQADSKAALDEASAAVKLDKDSARGWYAIMTVSLDTGQDDEAMRAFKELVRIDPVSTRAYLTFLAVPASGEKSRRNRDAVLALAVKNLRPRDANVARATSTIAGEPDRQRLVDVLKLAGKALRQSEDFDSDTFELACRATMSLGQSRDSVTLARMGFGEDPSPKWRTLLASAHMMLWRDTRDAKALAGAQELMVDYVEEMPGDPYGHNLLGYSLMAQGKRSEAASEFHKASELDPNDQNAAYWLKRMR